jgi:predicted Zn-dependent peptidase
LFGRITGFIIVWAINLVYHAKKAMHLLKLFSLSTLLFLVPGIVCAEPARLSPSEVGLTQLRKGVQEFTLSNGLKVLMYRRGIAPVFSGVVGVREGGSDEQPGMTGISHMFEHMAFKGTSQIGTRDFKREKPLLEELEKIVSSVPRGSQLSGEKRQRWDEIHAELAKLWTTEEFTRAYEKEGATGINATTDTELTRYFESMPSAAFEFWCRMESARIIDPVMRQFYQERDVVMEERRMRTEDSPEGKLYEEMLGVAFKRHPYRFPVIGYSEDIRSLTATDLERFRKTYYVPSNIVISLVGDVDETRDRPLLERYFGRIPTGPKPPRPSEVEPPQLEERQFTTHFPASPLMYVGYRKPVYPNADDAALSVMAEMLAGSSISPLYTELVKKKKVALSVDVSEAPGVAYPNLLIFSLVPKSPYSNNQLLESFDEVLTSFKEQGVAEDRLEIAKRAMATDFLAKMKSNLSLAIDLASTELVHGSWQVIIDWFEQVMRVSPDDVQRVARQYLVAESRTVAKLESTESQR